MILNFKNTLSEHFVEFANIHIATHLELGSHVNKISKDDILLTKQFKTHITTARVIVPIQILTKSKVK